MDGIWSHWSDLAGAIALNAESIQRIVLASDSLFMTLLIVLLAGLSLGIGQAVILFINQVKPVRFIFSLLLNAVLFTFGFLSLVLSTWLICQLPASVNLPFLTLVKVLGLSYAPLLFSFLGALPYVGVPLLNLLSIWRLLAAVVGFSVIAGVSLTAAFGYVSVGWFMLQLLENTVGQPIASLGKALANRVAGVELAENRSALVERVKSGIGVSSPLLTADLNPLPQASNVEATSLETSRNNRSARFKLARPHRRRAVERHSRSLGRASARFRFLHPIPRSPARAGGRLRIRPGPRHHVRFDPQPPHRLSRAQRRNRRRRTSWFPSLPTARATRSFHLRLQQSGHLRDDDARSHQRGPTNRTHRRRRRQIDL